MALDPSSGARRRPIRAFGGVSAATFDRIRVIGRLPPPLPLQSQQLSPHHEQVGERSADLQAMQIHRQPPITHLLEPEHPFHHADRVLDLGPHPRPLAVPGLDVLIDPAAEAEAANGAVLRRRRTAADHLGLPLIRLIAPDPVSRPCSRCGSASQSATFAAESSTARGLAVLLKPRQCPLLHRPPYALLPETTQVSQSFLNRSHYRDSYENQRRKGSSQARCGGVA